jgi:hypothetical protein
MILKKKINCQIEGCEEDVVINQSMFYFKDSDDCDAKWGTKGPYKYFVANFEKIKNMKLSITLICRKGHIYPVKYETDSGETIKLISDHTGKQFKPDGLNT